MSTLDLAGQPAALQGVVVIRRARECDRAALAEMFARCAVQTRYRRFHGHVNVLPARYLDEALSGAADHLGLVAAVAADPGDGSGDGSEDGSGDGPEAGPEAGPGDASIVALASCRTVAPRVADIGVLVEDGWQRLGIGNALLREIAGHANRDGIDVLTAQILAEQSWIVRLLGAYGSCESTTSHGVLEVTLRLGVTHGGRTR